MKKTILIVALAVVALATLSTGVVFAQGTQPPTGRTNMGYMHTYMVAGIAEKLGLSVDEVNSRLAAGESMYVIALAEGITAEEFPTFISEIRAAALDAAVEDSVITQEQADWMKSGGFGRGMMGGQGFNGTCPMNGTGYTGQRGSGMMGGPRWQNQNP